MTDDRTNERLDQMITRLGDLSGEVRAMQSRIMQLEASIERLSLLRHSVVESPHYWTIIASFILAAAIIAAIVLFAGLPR